MTREPGGDVRGYYHSLGVELSAWAGANASCRCFANPDAHNHEDRSPSCSVSMDSGAFKCWACGAEGGAFDAATALGRSDREAMDLLIDHDLAERRPAGIAPTHNRSARAPRPGSSSPPPTRRRLQLTDRQVRDWQRTLVEQPWPLPSLRAQHRQLWTRQAVTELGCGWDGQRLTFPIRTADDTLQGALRYASRHDRTSKAFAVPGTTLGLIPHPAAVDSQIIVIAEGLPDLVAARAQDLPAVAVPGTKAWDSSWSKALAGRIVITLMDCDDEGRIAAAAIRRDLTAERITARSLDLAPDRDDGYDLSDWLLDHPDVRGEQLRRRIIERARLSDRPQPASTCG